jgi:hypothetical protein
LVVVKKILSEVRSLWTFDTVPTTVATIGALFAPIVGIGGLEQSRR